MDKLRFLVRNPEVLYEIFKVMNCTCFTFESNILSIFCFNLNIISVDRIANTLQHRLCINNVDSITTRKHAQNIW